MPLRITPSVAEQEGQQTETEATGAPQKHHYTLNQQVGSITAKLISEIKSLKTSFPDWEKISILLSVLHKDEFETLMLKIKYELFLVNVKDINSIEYDFYRLLKQKRINEKFNAENIPIHIEEMISYALEESDEFRQLIDDDYKYIMACCAVIEKMSGNEAKK